MTRKRILFCTLAAAALVLLTAAALRLAGGPGETPPDTASPSAELSVLSSAEDAVEPAKEELSQLVEAEEAPRDLTPEWEEVMAIRREAIRKAKSGRTLDAITDMEGARKILPESELVSRDLSHLYAVMGWKKYKADELDKALGFFKESLYHWPDNQEAHRGLAYTHFRRGDRVESELWVNSYIEAGGDRADVYALLARICYESNRLESAQYFLALSLAIDPEQPDIKAMLEKIKRENEVETGFDRSETSHFLIKYEGQKMPWVWRIVEVVCEQAYLKTGQELGIYPRRPVTVILYTDRQFRDVTRSPAWAGAIFDGKIRIPAKGLTGRTSDLERIVFHEYTHAAVHDYTRGRAPMWLHEGLAQMQDGTPMDFAFMARRLSAAGGPVPIKNLEGSFLGLPKGQAELAYIQSALAIRYLDVRYGSFASRDLLRNLSEGDRIGKAVEDVTYRSYERFDRDFDKWVHKTAGE